MRRLCLAILFCLLACIHLQAHGIECRVPGKAILLKDSVLTVQPVTDTVTHVRKHKLVAALLAFPLGVFGLHRMYLGSSGIMPVIYIATFGGGFGILPFIDCVLILINKDVNTYTRNPRLFMWSKPDTKNK